MKEELIKINKFRSYAKYLLDNHLDEFVTEDLKRATEVDLPLLKLFSHLPEKDFFAVFQKATAEILTEIIEGRALEGSYKLFEKLKNNNLEGLPKDKLAIQDIALSYNVRKHSFFHFLPKYTADMKEAIDIITEIEDFFAHRQYLAFEAYNEISTEILRNSEESFRSLAEASFEGIAIHDNKAIIEVNQMLASMLGYTREELVGKDIFQFSPPSEHAKIQEKSFSGSSQLYETVGIRKDGSVFPVEIIGRIIIYKGKKVRVTGLRDITERKKQEEEKKKYYESLEALNEQLKKEKDFNQILIDNAVDSIIAFDRNMTITAWNKTLEQTGVKREDAIGKNYYDVFPQYKGKDSYLEEVWKGNTVSLKEQPFRKSIGYYDAEIVPLFNRENEIVGALSYSRDVTERKLTEQRLREQEHFIKYIADSSPSLIYVYDYISQKFVFINKTLIEFTGIPEETFYNADTAFSIDHIHPDDIPEILQRQKEYEHAKDEDVFYLEYRNRNTAGEWRWLATTTKIFKRSQEGKVWQVIGIALDITEKKQMQEILYEKTKTFQTILDSIPVMVFWKDTQNNFLGFNKAYQEAVNIPAEQLLSKNVNDLFPDGEKYLKDDLEVIRSGQSKLNIVEAVESPGGTFYAKTDKVPLRNARGEIIGIIGSAMDITELKRAQNDLHDLNTRLEQRVQERTKEVEKNQNQLTLITNSVPELIAYIDKDYRYVFVNESYQRWFGIEQVSVIGKQIREVIGDAAFFFVKEYVDQALSGSPVNFENYVPYNDRKRYIQASLLPDKDVYGTTRGVILFISDLTELIRAQEEIKEHADRVNGIIEAIPTMAWASLPDGTITYLNKAWYDFTGAKNINEWKWEKHIAPEDLERTTERWEYSLKTGTLYEIEYRWVRHDGKKIWMLGRANPIRNSRGEIIQWIGTATDIQHQKETEEKFKFLAETIPQFTWTAQPDGMVDYFNRRWFSYTGQSPDEAYGHGWLEALHPEDKEPARRLWAYAVENKVSVNQEYRIRSKNGTYKWFLAQGVPMKDEAGKVVKWFGTCTDIHDQKMINQELRNKNEELTRINNDLDNFIYTASHDLKAPISNIEGLMTTLLDTISPDNAQGEDFKTVTGLMYKSISRFKSTIQDLTDISKAQKSYNEDISPIDVCKVTEEVKDNIMGEIRKSEAEIVISTEQCPVIPFSKKNFRSIVYNLIINGIKYRSPERKPRITISTYNTDGYSVLEVKDNGLGIRKEHQGKIFEMFRRLHDHVEGTGIGLYIVRRMVDNAQGKIEVESEPGMGSVFRVYFRNRH